MWKSKDVVLLKKLSDELFSEVRRMPPSAKISNKLWIKLEKLSISERKDVVNRIHDGCTPLFIACKRGLTEVAEYLCANCCADLELKGLFEVPDDRSMHHVTPLWCAAVAGKADVVKVLLNHGAEINSVSDSGSTPVRSACFMTNVEIVKYLVEKGADIQKPNFNGGTCLINSVQSEELSRFLLDHGAEINAQDMRCKTALHYAIEEHRFETVKLLIERGADPYIKNKLNNDALQTACTKGALQIFNYLLNVLDLTVAQVADGYELLGSTFLDEHHDIHEAIQQWKTAAYIRQNANITKQVQPPIRAFGYVKEFANVKELDEVLYDHDAIRIQSLLICQRVLGSGHKDTIFRLMFRGAAYADSLQFQKCIQLWLYALELRIKKDTILYTEVYFTAHALVKLFFDILDKHSDVEVQKIILYEDSFHALELIGNQIGPSIELMSEIKESRLQQSKFDQALNTFLHFMYVACRVASTMQQRDHLKTYVERIVCLNPRTFDKKLSLLHLCVKKSDLLCAPGPLSMDSKHQQSPFPSAEVAEFLLDCGAPINATCNSGMAPLYLACYSRNFKKQVVELLLSRGAHPDQCTGSGESALGLLNSYSHTLPPHQHVLFPFPPLKCLAARVIRQHRIPLWPGDLPVELTRFLQLH